MPDNFEQLIDYLHTQGLLLVTAESCTAGLIAAMLGDCPGCGEWLDCGFITYSIASKQTLLAVSPETIKVKGLTSEEVAIEMVLGALKNSHANVAIANTGVAGPANGDDGTPAGTVCLAWGFRSGGETLTYAETRRFEGERNNVRKQAAEYGLNRIIHYHKLSPCQEKI
jgi:nicotinamide-nucleotide amidase